MAYVVSREGESGESLIKRFRLLVEHGGILREIKNRQFFRSKSERTRMAKRLAIRRAARREQGLRP